MTRNARSTLILTTCAALGLAAMPALAHGPGGTAGDGATPMHGTGMWDHHGQGRGQGYRHGPGMMGGSDGGHMMQGNGMTGAHGGGYHGGHMMPGYGMMMGGAGMMGGMHGPAMMGNMLEQLDADGDGRVTPDEMREGVSARMLEFDSDDDGTMTLEEFEAFHAAMIRNMVVDRFQALDENGDGRITDDEMRAPADRMERFQRLNDQRREMWQRRQDMGPQGGQQRGMGQGRMMNDN